MKNILLDTNAYDEFLSGHPKVLDIISQSEWIHFSIFVMAELLAGFRGGTKEELNKQYLAVFLDKPGVNILEAGMVTAEYFALIKDQLKKDGRPIPLNDIWIAAHAMQTASIVITHDRHFGYIKGLRVEYI